MGTTRSPDPLFWSCILVTVVAGGIALSLVLLVTGKIGPGTGEPVPTPTPTPSVTPLPTPPTPAVDTSAIVVSGNSVTIHWRPVAGVSTYGVSYEGYETPPYAGRVLEFDRTGETTYTWSGLVAGIEYEFRIGALGDGSRYAGSGRPARVKVQIPPPVGTNEEGRQEAHE